MTTTTVQVARRIAARLESDGIQIKPSQMADITRIVEETEAQETIRVLTEILGAMRELNTSLEPFRHQQKLTQTNRQLRNTIVEKALIPVAVSVATAILTLSMGWAAMHGVTPPGGMPLPLPIVAPAPAPVFPDDNH